MAKNEVDLIPFDPTIQAVPDSNIGILPQERGGFGYFYAILRPGTLQVINAAQKLLHNDTELPEPQLDPRGYLKAVREKYGINEQIPETPLHIGFYNLTKLQYIAISEPTTYSSGFKPPALQHLLGLNDPIDALLHCAEILIDQADYHKLLRPAFADFPAQLLYEIDISGVVVSDRSTDDILDTTRKIDQFRRNHLRNMLSWQGGLDG